MKRMLALALAVSAAQPAYADSIQQMRQERRQQPFSAIDQIRFEKEKQMTEAWVNFQKTIAKHSEAAPARQPGHSAGEQRLTILPGTTIPSPYPGVLPPPVESDSKELRAAVAKFLGLDPDQISTIRVVVLPSGEPMKISLPEDQRSRELLEIKLRDGRFYVGQGQSYYRFVVDPGSTIVTPDGFHLEIMPWSGLVQEYQVDWLTQTVAEVGIGTIRQIASFLKVKEQDIASIEYKGQQLAIYPPRPYVTIQLKNGQRFEASLKPDLQRGNVITLPGHRTDPFGRLILQVSSLRDTRVESYTLMQIAKRLNVGVSDILSVRGDIDGVSNGFFVEVKLRDGRQFIGEIGWVPVGSGRGEITLPAFRQGLLWMAESEVGIGTLREIAPRLGIQLSQFDGARIRIHSFRSALGARHYGHPYGHHPSYVFIRMADGATRRVYLRASYGDKDELGYDVYTDLSAPVLYLHP